MSLTVSIIVLMSVLSQSLVAGWATATSSEDKELLKGNTPLLVDGQKLPRTVILDPYALLKMKHVVMMKQNDSIIQDFLNKIIIDADSVLAKRPTSVTEKTQFPPNGTKHDFFALASYEWPNPNTTDGLPYVSRDGYTNPETLLIQDKWDLNALVNNTMALALASYFTDNPKYASKAEELLRVWFLDNDTYMKPSLNYGQFERGKGRLNPSGIMDANQLPYLIDAVGMLELAPKWNSTVTQGLKLWFTNYLDWLLNSDLGKIEGQRKNNHGTYYTVQASAIAFFVNKLDITEKLLKSTMQDLSSAPLEDVSRLIAVKINPDGTQPFEIRRADSLHYHIWNLHGLSLLARIGDRAGVDLWNYKIHDTGMRKALDFVLPFALEKQPWPYSQIKVSDKQVDEDDLSFLQGVVCQAVLHYNNQSYLQAYRSLSTKDLDTHIQDIICKLQINYVDTGSSNN